MASFKVIFIGVKWEDDGCSEEEERFGGSSPVLWVRLLDEKLDRVNFRVSNPRLFGYFCDQLQLGTRLCINATPDWQTGGVVAISSEIQEFSTVSRHALRPDGTASYLCDGYCEESRSNEAEFGRTGVCRAYAPPLSPDVPGVVKAGFLKEVMRLMPEQDGMELLRRPGLRDGTSFSYTREDGSPAIFTAHTEREGNMYFSSVEYAKADGGMLVRLLMDIDGSSWTDEFGIGYRFRSFSFYGGGQANVTLDVDTSKSSYATSLVCPSQARLSLSLHSNEPVCE